MYRNFIQREKEKMLAKYAYIEWHLTKLGAVMLIVMGNQMMFVMLVFL